MTDTIELRGMRVLALCGALPEEKTRSQPFEIDLDVHVDLDLASSSDELRDTVDYGQLTAMVARIADDNQFELMERFAGCIAEEVMGTGGVVAVTVAVRKLRPPVPVDLASSGVRIHRST